MSILVVENRWVRWAWSIHVTSWLIRPLRESSHRLSECDKTIIGFINSLTLNPSDLKDLKFIHPGKFDRGQKTILHDEPHCLPGCSWEDWVQARCDGVPVSAGKGTSLPCRVQTISFQLLNLMLTRPAHVPSSSTICQPEPSHCASLSTQHVWGCRAFHYVGQTAWNSARWT